MRTILTHPRRLGLALSVCLAGTTALTACGTEESGGDTSASTSGSETGAAEESHDHEGEESHDHGDDAKAAEPTETAGAQPRIAYTYDGGVQVLDATTLKPVGKPLEAEGFVRLNDMGDGRHLALSEGNHWQVLDLGVWSQPHGDHSHSYAKDPVRTDIAIEGEHPGHVTFDHGRVLTWADGTGTVKEFTAESLLAGVTPKTKDWTAEHAHHGVAVPTHDGGMLVTVGTEDERNGVMALDADGKKLAEYDNCPGVHGEAEVKGGVVFGCENGAVIWDGKRFKPVDGPGDYSRVGTIKGSAKSPVAFHDLEVQKDAEFERPEQVAMTDVRTGTMRTVDLGTSYWFRSLGRASDGDGLVLGYDGALHRIDTETGKVTDKLPVIKAWKEKEDWQKPGPALHVMGDTAWVTEPATQKVHRIDLKAWKVTKSATLEHVPNELNGVDAEVPEFAVEEEHGDHGHEGHDHGEGHDHDHEHDHGEGHDHEGHDHEHDHSEESGHEGHSH